MRFFGATLGSGSVVPASVNMLRIEARAISSETARPSAGVSRTRERPTVIVRLGRTMIGLGRFKIMTAGYTTVHVIAKRKSAKQNSEMPFGFPFFHPGRGDCVVDGLQPVAHFSEDNRAHKRSYEADFARVDVP